MSLVENPTHRTIALDADVWAAVEAVANANDMTRSAFVRKILREAVLKYQSTSKKPRWAK